MVFSDPAILMSHELHFFYILEVSTNWFPNILIPLFFCTDITYIAR